eukprot:GFUD01029794.1.p1 GENE.GFUD01029794.1~~GFUD01029794.1.p1  ORF type:complete len:385 (-),score=84.00 GFUD01029794.1:12-1031(-)
MVLLQAFPCLKELVEPQSDQIVLIVPDTPAHVIEGCREALYKEGDINAFETLLGFRNDLNLSKTDQEDEAYNTDDYVDMDVLQDFEEVKTLQENTYAQLPDTNTHKEMINNSDYMHTEIEYEGFVNAGFEGFVNAGFVKEEESEEKKPKKSSVPKISDAPFFFLQTGRSRKKGSHGSQGVLITHDSFTFNRNNSSRDYLKEWWQCKERKGPYLCQATATTQSLDGKNYFLRYCSKPEEHIHAPDKVTIFKDRLIIDIKMLIKKIPTTGKLNYEKAKNIAIEDASDTYLNDPKIRHEVVALLDDPNFKLNKKISSFKSSFKQQVVAKINKELADSGFNFN